MHPVLQRLMERMFGAQHFQSLLLNLYDVVVFSSTVQEHIHRLEMVLSHLQKEGLKLKLEKCAFFRMEVKYLGHIISRDGVSTDPERIAAVSSWVQPTRVSELRSFLGFASYYRRFVAGISKLAAPFHRLVGEMNKVRGSNHQRLVATAWTKECEDSFQTLKKRLASAPTLAYANFSLPFLLEVDASFSGLGAVLSQEHEGKVRPIAYAMPCRSPK